MIKNIYKMELKIELLSGLHIGGGNENYDIGGSDSNVIKNPITNEPYIPGSSLKGKLRAMVEYKEGKLPEIINEKSKISLDDNFLKIFAPAESDNIKQTRAIFRDLYLTKESVEKLTSTLGINTYTEIKAENVIDKLNSSAMPRFIERVPKGAKFEGEIVLMEFEEDDIEEMKSIVINALDLLELNYLGASGSRGYGRIKVISKKEFDKVEI